jgi:hypothetical protein
MAATLWFLSGIVLGVVFIAIARALGERLIISVGLAVAASIYIVFAAFGAGWSWIGIEALGVVLYGIFAVLGVRYSPWWLVAGWAAHPIWDVGLHLIGGGSEFSPAGYAIQCIGLDLVVAAYVAYQYWRFGAKSSFAIRTPSAMPGQ